MKKLNAVFWVSLFIAVLFVIWGALSPQSLQNNATRLFDLTTKAFGWFYLLAATFFVLFCLFLMVSKYGKIKLGKDGDKPDYPFFTWVGMLFSAGFGVGLVFWGVAEPMMHFAEPPMGEAPLSADAARLAMRYSFFHWGVHQWSVFTIVGLIMAYLQFRRDEPGLISTSFNPLIGTSGKGWLRKSIDILAVIATITGVATSLGLGILQINGGLKHLFQVPNNAMTQIVITVILLVLYLLSSTTGLDKGIKWLSNLNMGLALALMLFVLIFGPTIFILNSFTLALGDYIQNFFEMSLRMTPYKGGSWVRDWTVFYWAWAIAWSPFVGAFIARVSRGRTIREFVFGVFFVPPFIAIFWMAVFGGTALHMELMEQIPISSVVLKDVSSALFTTLENLPFSMVVSILSILLIFTFLITSADSATFVLGMLTSNGDLSPSTNVKVIWGVLQAAIAVVLIISSGLQGLQTASLVAALPFTFILIVMCISLFTALKREKPKKVK